MRVGKPCPQHGRCASPNQQARLRSSPDCVLAEILLAVPLEPKPPPAPDASLTDFAAGAFRRLTAHLIDQIFILIVVIFWPLMFVLLAWWLFVLARGQTPGKQIVGIFAVRRDATRFGWGRMFIRENFRVLFWALTIGLGSVADSAAILLRKDRRSVTDLVAGSVIVYVPSS